MDDIDQQDLASSRGMFQSVLLGCAPRDRFPNPLYGRFFTQNCALPASIAGRARVLPADTLTLQRYNRIAGDSRLIGSTFYIAGIQHLRLHALGILILRSSPQSGAAYQCTLSRQVKICHLCRRTLLNTRGDSGDWVSRALLERTHGKSVCS